MKKIAIDAYYNNGICHVVGGIFDNWTDEHVLKFIYADVKVDSDYIPGEFYKRELPGILKLLEQIDLNEFDTIIVDGYVYLVEPDNVEKPGLGMRLYWSLRDQNKPVKSFSIVGIAKSLYGENEEAYNRCFRGNSKNPLYITTSTDWVLGLSPGDLAPDILDQIHNMSGEYRIPTIIKEVDSETKKYWK